MDEATEKIIAQIFSADTGWHTSDQQRVFMSPGYDEIKSFASLLSTSPPEERLQEFLEEHPRLLMGLFGMGNESNVAFITKPPIGKSYNADFGILQISQAGASVDLVEIEQSDASLFTQKGTPARTLQSAMGQVRDWHQWISINQQTFIRDTVELAKRLPPYPERSSNNSFRMRSAEGLEQAWRVYGGYDLPIIKYTVIVGRWAELSDDQRKRLIFLNRTDNHLHNIYTFDQVARMAYSRPWRIF